eukprot:1161090-Pelagomonas_calceolata.AAC.5
MTDGPFQAVADIENVVNLDTADLRAWDQMQHTKLYKDLIMYPREACLGCSAPPWRGAAACIWKACSSPSIYVPSVALEPITWQLFGRAYVPVSPWTHPFSTAAPRVPQWRLTPQPSQLPSESPPMLMVWLQVMPIFDSVAKNMAAENLGTQENVPDIQVCRWGLSMRVGVQEPRLCRLPLVVVYAGHFCFVRA